MYQENFWTSQHIWNRQNMDSGITHEPPIPNQTNYIYVRVKNRGYQQAEKVKVSAYPLPSAAELTWPADITKYSMKPTSITDSNPIPPGGSKVFGPFKWTPVQDEHEALLATVTAVGDRSNVDPSSTLPCATGPTPLCQLVPFDNNIALRNVVIVPGGGGKKNLKKAMSGQKVHVKNPFDAKVRVTSEWSLPSYLTKHNWYLSVSKANRSFELDPNAKGDVCFKLVAGKAFKKAEVVALGIDSVIEFRAWADGQLIGGITYQIDPDVTKPVP